MIILLIEKLIKLTSKKKEIDCRDIIYYWPTIIKEVLDWLYILNVTDCTEDKIYSYITLLPSLLNTFSMFQIRCWYNKVHDDQNKVKHISISCINCGKQTGLSMDNMNTK